MVRLLIIGREADEWREDLQPWTDRSLGVEAETLPSAGIREFSETAPDAVAIAEPGGSPRTEPIARALLDQPLGQLVPIVTLGTSYRGDADLEVAAEVGVSAGAEGLVRRLEELLDAELPTAARNRQTESSDELEVERGESSDPTLRSTEIPTRKGDGAAGREEFVRDVAAGQHRAELESTIERPDYVLEPVSDEDGRSAGATGESMSEEAPDPPDPGRIEEKLEEVRHSGYFTILEVPRSADGETVRRAYRSLKRQFRRDHLPDAVVNRFDAEIAEIHDALDDASAVLGDERLRRAYRAATDSV